eukprot:Gb_26691 [translate_table: standard]
MGSNLPAPRGRRRKTPEAKASRGALLPWRRVCAVQPQLWRLPQVVHRNCQNLWSHHRFRGLSPGAGAPDSGALRRRRNCTPMASNAGPRRPSYRSVVRISGRLFQPLRIVGMVMTQPFFGGVERTESETRLAHDKIVPLAAADLLWSLALPEGADRDHEFCNPLKRPSPLVGRLPRSLVAVEGMDPLHDRGLEFVKMLKESGVEVVLRRDPTGFHGVQLFDMQKAKELCNDLRNFINSPPPPSSL